jgi:YVTN family beta-propeller protein/cysteine-rich repeat protein
VIDTATNTVAATVGVGNVPIGVAVTPDGAFAYVANAGSDTVSVIDTATNTVAATVGVGDLPLALGQFIGPVVCGNGMVGSGEQCDDGNTTNGDGCSSTCQLQNRPPVAQCQNVTVNACGGVTASIDNGSSDPDSGDTITLSQSPAGPYGLGTTSVTLTVTDSHGATASCTGTVTVADQTAPSITCPGNQTATATSAGGAVVNFSVTSNDNCGTVMTSCSPSSGSTFPIGSTGVTCTATDGAALQNSCSFSVTVTADALAQLNNLITIVQNLPVQPAVKVVLKAPLLVAKAALEHNKSQVACASLRVFEGLVAQLRKTNKLTAAQATQLTTESQSIRTALRCP